MECIYCGYEEQDEKATVCKQCGEPLMNEEELERHFASLFSEAKKDHLEIEQHKQLQATFRQLPAMTPEDIAANNKTPRRKTYKLKR